MYSTHQVSSELRGKEDLRNNNRTRQSLRDNSSLRQKGNQNSIDIGGTAKAPEETEMGQEESEMGQEAMGQEEILKQSLRSDTRLDGRVHIGNYLEPCGCNLIHQTMSPSCCGPSSIASRPNHIQRC